MTTTLQDATDWKSKYYEATDLLAETKAELDDFQTASKELEEELERELQRTESEKERLRLISSKAERECSEWKDKFINLQTLHNSTTNSLQRDLDTCRRECHNIKVHMRELEMGNDNLERNERAVASSMAELEIKYSKALEEKILLEHELMDKANLEEALQRLKDELRDTLEEVESLKQQVAKEAKTSELSPAAAASGMTAKRERSSLRQREARPSSSHEVFMDHRDSKSSLSTREPVPELPGEGLPDTARETDLCRSNTLPPTLTLPKRSPLPQQLLNEKPPFPRKGSTSSTASTLPAAKSKGVQMVSEMRARVRNLELKIHSRVPRLRMGSFSRSTSPRHLKSSANENSTPLNQNRPSIDQLSLGSRSRTSMESNNRQGAESPGWVLILEETPVRKVRKDGERGIRGAIPRSPRPPAVANRAIKHSNDVPGQDLHRSGNLKHRLQVAGTSRPLTPTALPMPTQRATPSTFKPLQGQKDDDHDLTLTMKSSVFNQSARPASAASRSTDISRRQSGGSNVSGQSEVAQERSAPRSGRSSLPNAFVATSQLSSIGAEGNQSEGPLIQSSGGFKPTSTTSIFARSRIGKPAKRTSGGVPARRISVGNGNDAVS